MEKIFVILFIISLAYSCKSTEKENIVKSTYKEVKTAEYELYASTKYARAVLVLFGGYPEKAKDIKREFKILEAAEHHEISILFMNYNKKLWMHKNEKQELSENLQNIFHNNKLPKNNIYLGGFSSGGNVALLISDFLTQKEFDITPKGVFIVDSPIDLAELYKSSEKNIKRNFSEVSVKESTWIRKTLENQFGNPHNDITKYQKYSVFTAQTEHIDNVKNLKNTKIRFYTEPDTIWWKKNRMADYNQTNAYYIKRLSEKLNIMEYKNVHYIPTKHKGYRHNGERHPHSWSIVDTENLIKWMLN